MITRSSRSSKKDEKPKIEVKPKRNDVKRVEVKRSKDVIKLKNVKTKSKIDEKEVKKPNSVVAKNKKNVNTVENMDLSGKGKKSVLKEAKIEVGKPEKDVVKKHVPKEAKIEVGIPEKNDGKHKVPEDAVLEVGKPEKDDVKRNARHEKMEVGKPEEDDAKKNVRQEEKMEVGKPDVYEFDEIDENVPNKKRKRKVLKITKMRAKRTHNEANMIKKAEINMRTNVHIKHKKTLTDYEKFEFDDINKKPVVKIQRPVGKVQTENVKMKTPLKVLDTNVRILAKTRSLGQNNEKAADRSFTGSPLVMKRPVGSPAVMSTPVRSPMKTCSPAPVRAPMTPVGSPAVMSTPVSLPPIRHTPIVDFPLPSPSSDFSEVYASTPVKYFPVESKFNVSNNFGFDVDVSLPALSPFEGLKIVRKVEEVKKDTISAQEVIKKLRFELNEPDTVEEIETAETTDTTEIVPEEPRSPLGVYDPTVPEPEISIRPPRRSYERSFRPKKKKIIAGLIEDEESSEDDEIQPKKYIKKKPAPKEKKNPAMDKWVEEFNKHCKEVEQFNLCVE